MALPAAELNESAALLDDTPKPSRKRKRPQIGTLSVSEGL
jgi:hypothetical protein